MLTGSWFPAVFPTRVGVNRSQNTTRMTKKRIPHACGGEPVLVVDIYRPRERIPHACGGEPIDGRYDGKPHEGIPHACGGEPG